MFYLNEHCVIKPYGVPFKYNVFLNGNIMLPPSSKKIKCHHRSINKFIFFISIHFDYFIE